MYVCCCVFTHTHTEIHAHVHYSPQLMFVNTQQHTYIRMYVYIHTPGHTTVPSYPFIPEFREGVHNDTEHDVQTNCGHNDEEGQVKDGTWDVQAKI